MNLFSMNANEWSILVFGLIFGMAIGGAVIAFIADSMLQTFEDDCENHESAALILSRKLAAERAKVEMLEDQVDGLLAIPLPNDDSEAADYWKKQEDTIYRDRQL